MVQSVNNSLWCRLRYRRERAKTADVLFQSVTSNIARGTRRHGVCKIEVDIYHSTGQRQALTTWVEIMEIKRIG